MYSKMHEQTDKCVNTERQIDGQMATKLHRQQSEVGRQKYLDRETDMDRYYRCGRIERHGQKDRWSDWQMNYYTDKQTDRQTDRLAGRQTDRKTDRQTERQEDRQTGQADR